MGLHYIRVIQGLYSHFPCSEPVSKWVGRVPPVAKTFSGFGLDGLGFLRVVRVKDGIKGPIAQGKKRA